MRKGVSMRERLEDGRRLIRRDEEVMTFLMTTKYFNRIEELYREIYMNPQQRTLWKKIFGLNK